uniref:Uncharacterized protein n=1 Tax=Arundo donax TaxID=35708 RepID=A0A0A9FPX2_ARUDO
MLRCKVYIIFRCPTCCSPDSFFLPAYLCIDILTSLFPAYLCIDMSIFSFMKCKLVHKLLVAY